MPIKNRSSVHFDPSLLSCLLRVYLCGPITGQSPEASMRWRDYATRNLAPKIITIDPTRDLPDTVQRSSKPGTLKTAVMRAAHGKRTVARDRFDVMRADILLANFLGAEAASIGSVGEIVWADIMQKPIIIVREPSGNIHDHDMLNELAGWIFHDLDQALALIKVLVR